MRYLGGRLDEIKSQLSACESRERKGLEELERVKDKLEAKDTLAKTIESKLQQKLKALEHAGTREDKLIHQLRLVRMYIRELGDK